MKKLLLISMLYISFAAQAATSIKAEVNGMVCAFCAKGIEKKLKALPEGQATFVDLKSRIVVLELKDKQTVPMDRFKNIIKEAGYDVKSAETVEMSAAEIKAQLNAAQKGEAK